jgi:type VI secretion system protein ImpI
MHLELTVLRCPDAVPPEARTVTGGEFTVGRGPGVDWVLPDPERLLSKRHFTVAFRSGSWQLADTSTNGTFLNTDDSALGGGEVRTLRNGDRVRLGAYEIEARLIEDSQQYGGARNAGFGGPPAGGHDPFGDPFGMDPLAPLPPTRAHQAFGEPGQSRQDIAPILPDDFDLMAPDPLASPSAPHGHQPFQTKVQSDHSSVMEDAFQPPRASGQTPMHAGGIIPGDDLLPDDWDNDLLEGIGQPAKPQPPEPPPRVAPPVAPPVFEAPPPRPAPPTRATPPAPSLDRDASPFDEPSDVQGAHRLGQPIVPAPQVDEPSRPPSPSASVFDEPLEMATPAVVAAPISAPPAARADPAAEPAGDASLLAAFLEGAGMPDGALKDPAATMRGLGLAFRAMVSGLREVLMARASIKSEFRIEQTMIRARGNNPLKFSAGDDDALSALLGAGRRVDMTPAAAVADALKDIRLHELASMAAMQSAVRAMLSGLDPAKLRAVAEQSGGMTVIPAQKKARAWDVFEALHAQTVQALSDDFDSVFGKAFARAYERALEDVSAKDKG